jgi:hypothetical protein
MEENIEKLVINITNNFTKILSTNEIRNKYSSLYWGGNGVGDRWCKKIFNYTVIYKNKEPKLYSENDNIPTKLLEDFLNNNNGSGIIGIFVHSKRINTQNRSIDKKIHKKIINLSCIICGTNDTICDHKNDLYNDERVLNIKTQLISDFQPLCNHCNLQKRQVSKDENKNKKIYSAKNIQRYKIYSFDFPWEKKIFDKNDINCKNETYWFDPIEFDKKIYYYVSYTIPIINEIKKKVKNNKLKIIN